MFLLIFAEFELLRCFTTILWNLQEKLNKQNLLKTCRQVTYLTDFYIICIYFTMRKKWKYLIF